VPIQPTESPVSQFLINGIRLSSGAKTVVFAPEPSRGDGRFLLHVMITDKNRNCVTLRSNMVNVIVPALIVLSSEARKAPICACKCWP
jgi:hypothetical protein